MTRVATSSCRASPGAADSAEARIKELDLGARAGKLLDAAEVKRAVSDMLMRCRAKLLLGPDELCDKLAATKDPVRCKILIDDKVCAALDELSQDPPDAPAKTSIRR